MESTIPWGHRRAEEGQLPDLGTQRPHRRLSRHLLGATRTDDQRLLPLRPKPSDFRRARRDRPQGQHLSGGEKFEASLGLALGVAEIAGRSGIRFDTLFLDEGFAGLDQAHLNRALDALESEVEAGRCIVLITHIGSVADRIKDVLLIEPDDSGGSSTRWLNEEERFELGADLDLAVP